MTVSTISGRISNTITLGSAAYPGSLVILSKGDVAPTAAGANGIVLPAYAAGSYVTNMGTLTGGLGGKGLGAGAGVLFDATGTLTNSGKVTGGEGGNSGGAQAGGTGVNLLAGGYVVNSGSITGGAGGYNGITGAHGNGGIGVTLSAATLTNSGIISGGMGVFFGGVGFGGAGGVGLVLTGKSVATNSGSILGGSGNYEGGAGAIGVKVDASELTNTGTIVGGPGGPAFFTSNYPGGAGLYASNYAIVNNAGVIIGGDGGYNHSYGGAAGAGVTIVNATLTDSGTILGGAGGYGNEAYRGAGGAGIVSTDATLTISGAVGGGSGGTGAQAGVGVSLDGGSLLLQGTITGGSNVLDYFYGYSTAAGLVVTGAGSANIASTGSVSGGAGLDGLAYEGGIGLVLNGGYVTNAGTITGGAGGYYGTSGGAGGAGVVLDGGTLVVSGEVAGGAGGVGTKTTGAHGAAIQFGADAASLVLNAGASFVGSVIANGSNDSLVLSGSADGTLSGLGSKITGFASFTVSQDAHWLLTGANTISASTTVIDSGAHLNGSGSLSFLGSVANDGIINISPGTLSIAGSLSGTGGIGIGSSATLTLLSTAASNQTIKLEGSHATLDLGDSGSFAASIANFHGGDKIDLLNTPETGYNYADNVLTITDGTQVVASLNFEGSYSQSNFSVTSDNDGGTLITFK